NSQLSALTTDKNILKEETILYLLNILGLID
ncbi:MAG: hypothetical protein JWR09_2024, partial [Mucilaginibacter sp.]|nr:hypothetical protein [Mucilaginibacter sp.]